MWMNVRVCAALTGIRIVLIVHLDTHMVIIPAVVPGRDRNYQRQLLPGMNEDNETGMCERKFGSYRCPIPKLLPTIIDSTIRRVFGVTEFRQIDIRYLPWVAPDTHYHA